MDIVIKAIIVDDQLQAVKYLKRVLQEVEGIEVIAEAINAKSAVKLINQYKPDLVFLDIEMPDGDGFSVLEEFDIINFEVVFVTGFNDYAISAIKKNALDYILKPVQSEDLLEVIEKYRSRVQKSKPTLNTVNIVKGDNRLLLALNNGYKLTNINQILYVEASGRYSTFYFFDEPNIVVARHLKYYEELLEGKQFVRISASSLINLAYFDSYQRGAAFGQVILTSGHKLEVSKQKRSLLLSILKNYQ
ncbi:MAG: response regulator transcription factor [Flavobacteriaceae bacterium]|nr:response regulator transcription factor [Flavobacteriaceae bacterium]